MISLLVLAVALGLLVGNATAALFVWAVGELVDRARERHWRAKFGPLVAADIASQQRLSASLKERYR